MYLFDELMELMDAEKTAVRRAPVLQLYSKCPARGRRRDSSVFEAITAEICPRNATNTSINPEINAATASLLRFPLPLGTDYGRGALDEGLP